LTGSGLDDNQLLALAAAAERPSEHPLAAAIVDAATRRELLIGAVENFNAVPGRGITAVLDGRAVEIGSPTHVLPNDPPRTQVDTTDSHIAAVVAGLESDGKTVVVVRVDGQVVGVLGLEDRLRSSSTATVAALTDLTGNRPVLLTGDNQRAATALADRVGITDVRAGLLPHDKVTAVRALEADGSRVFSSATVSTTPLPSPLRTPGSPWAERAPTSPSTPQTPSSSATNYRPSRR
jgi:P-type E1-E2 ATPase